VGQVPTATAQSMVGCDGLPVCCKGRADSVAGFDVAGQFVFTLFVGCDVTYTMTMWYMLFSRCAPITQEDRVPLGFRVLRFPRLPAALFIKTIQ
jgi:hypothetical protein